MKPNKKSNKNLFILLLVLVVIGIAGVVWFVNLPQQQPPSNTEPPVVEEPVVEEPVVLTEQDKWFDNLDKLNSMPYPKFICNQFVNEKATVNVGDITVTDYFDKLVLKGEFRFTDELPSKEELFPVITPNEPFERCSLNIPVTYSKETSPDGSVNEVPDLSEVDGIVSSYDLGPNDETISHNVYPVGDNMADAVSNQIFLTNRLGLESEITDNTYGTTVTVNEIITIAFSTKEDLGNPPEEELEELRSIISEEQFLELNNSLINIL